MDHSSSLYLALDRLISICDKLTDSNGLQLKLTPTYFGLKEDAYDISWSIDGIADVCREYFSSYPKMILDITNNVQLGIIRDVAPPTLLLAGKEATGCNTVRIYTKFDGMPAHIRLMIPYEFKVFANFTTAGELRTLLRELYPLGLLGMEGSDPARKVEELIQSKQQEADSMNYGRQLYGFELAVFFKWFNLKYYKQLLAFNSTQPSIDVDSAGVYSISNSKIAIMIHDTVKGGRHVTVNKTTSGREVSDVSFTDSINLRGIILNALKLNDTMR